MKNTKEFEYTETCTNLKREIEGLTGILNSGIIGAGCATQYTTMINKNKEKFVSEVHKGKFTTLREKRKDGSIYELAATRPNGQKNYLRAKTKEELIEKLYDYYTGGAGQSMVMKDLFPKALTWKAEGKTSGRSIKEYDRIWKKYYLVDSIAKRRVNEIGAKEWKNFFRKICRDNNLSSSQFNNIRIVANIIMTYCVEEELITSNILRDLDYTDMPFADEETYHSIKSKPFEDDQLLDVIKWCQEYMNVPRVCPIYPLAILFNLNEGLRYAELAGLKWEDIDWNRKLVTVKRQLVRSVEVTDGLKYESRGKTIVNHTKAHVKPTPIHLTDSALEILEEIKALHLSDEFVFPQGSFRYHTYNEKVKRAAEAAGLDPKNFHTHCLRATVATNVYKECHDIRQVQHLLRHTTPGMTEKYVGNWWTQDAARKAMNKATKTFLNSMQDESDDSPASMALEVSG